MQPTPKLRVARFAELKPGELFVYEARRVSHVALAVRNSAQDEMLILPLGPTLPEYMTYPTLFNDPGTTVVSFGKDFALRLPVAPDAWSSEAPSPEVNAVALNKDGAFLRCNFSTHPRDFQPCYVDLTTGDVVVNQPGHAARFVKPPGILAYATSWSLTTLEDPARVILDSAAPPRES
jgi:hypothetical protein